VAILPEFTFLLFLSNRRQCRAKLAHRDGISSYLLLQAIDVTIEAALLSDLEAARNDEECKARPQSLRGIEEDIGAQIIYSLDIFNQVTHLKGEESARLDFKCRSKSILSRCVIAQYH